MTETLPWSWWCHLYTIDVLVLFFEVFRDFHFSLKWSRNTNVCKRFYSNIDSTTLHRLWKSILIAHQSIQSRKRNIWFIFCKTKLNLQCWLLFKIEMSQIIAFQNRNILKVFLLWKMNYKKNFKFIWPKEEKCCFSVMK